MSRTPGLRRSPSSPADTRQPSPAAFPGRARAALGCLVPGAAPDLLTPQAAPVYFALEHPAGRTSDVDLLRAPEVSLLAVTGPGSVACSAPDESFARVVERFSRDMAGETSASAGRTVPVLGRYQGTWFRTRIAAHLVSSPQELVAQQTSALTDPDVDEIPSGVTCHCVSGGSSCPKGGGGLNPAVWCDASNCQSCRMDF